MHEFLFDGPPDARLTLVLSHGAGAPMDSPWMSSLAANLGDLGWRVVRFEFPYMVARRQRGSRRPPDRMSTLEATWIAVLEQLGPAHRLAIGGKSMGGRVASRIADVAGPRGLVCLGYPFHPPARPQQLRTAHLADLRTPTLIVQGTRDPFGTPEEVATYDLSAAIDIVWISDGDHSFRPRRSSGRTESETLSECGAAVDAFLGRLAAVD